MGKKKSSEAALAEKEATKAAQRDAVHQSIQALGPDATVHEMSAWVKQHVGLEIDNKLVGLHKYHILPKEEKPMKKKKPGRKPKAEVEPSSNGPAEKKTATAKKEMVAFNDMVVVKGLIHRYGKEQIRAMIDLVTK